MNKYIDAILVFTPIAAERLANGHNRDPRSRNPKLNTGNFCGIYVSSNGFKQLKYSAEVNSVMQIDGATLLTPEVIDMLTFPPNEARKYIKPEKNYHLMTLNNVKSIEPIPLDDLMKSHAFNPSFGIKKYSDNLRPQVTVL